MIWAFEDFELDTDQFDLRRDGEQIRVEPQVYDVLVLLVENHDRVVPKEEILDTVWGDRFVSESALTSRVRAARRALADDGTAQRTIRTVHGRGYQFVAEVQERARRPESSAVGPVATDGGPSQEIRFCQTDDGARLAYASMGEGPPLVRSAHWMTHVDYDLESPVWRHWLESLADGRRLVRYDERGCGMSDHDVDPSQFSVDTWVSDLAAVVDAAGLDRFDLLGVSQGGPVAIKYAVQNPERVRRLVLYGTYIQGALLRAADDHQRREAMVQFELASVGWGSADDSYLRFFASQFMPDADRELWEEFGRIQRRTVSAENAARFMETFAHLDVTDAVSDLATPTLVLHARGDLRVPFEDGRELASLIPGSRLVPIETNNHLMTADEPAFATFLDEVNQFLDED